MDSSVRASCSPRPGPARIGGHPQRLARTIMYHLRGTTGGQGCGADPQQHRRAGDDQSLTVSPDINGDVGFVGVRAVHIAGVGNISAGLLLGLRPCCTRSAPFDPGALLDVLENRGRDGRSSGGLLSGRRCAPRRRPIPGSSGCGCCAVGGGAWFRHTASARWPRHSPVRQIFAAFVNRMSP